MNRKLSGMALSRFLSGLFIVGLLLFLSAGTLRYPQAWLMIGILFIPMLIAGIVMLFKNPMLLEKRLNLDEKEQEQRVVVLLSAALFAASFIAAGISFRFRLTLPRPVSIAAAVVFLASYALYAEVLRENTYLSRTVEVQENQKVIDTGLYGLVRHPMYMATVVLFLSMPLVLGSVISFCVMLLYIPVIVRRIRNEEKVLEKELPGYGEYMTRVRYRMIPFLW